MKNLPKTMHVVPAGHNRITFTVMAPHHDVTEYECAYKSTRGIEWARGWEPCYWYWCKTGRHDFITMLRKFKFEPDDELVISERDFEYIQSFVQAPVFDLSKKKVHIIEDVEVAMRKHKTGIFIQEPTEESNVWKDYKKGPGWGSGPGSRSSPEDLATFLRYDRDVKDVFLTASALEVMQLVFAQSALPVQVVHSPELPERVYNVQKPRPFSLLGAFARWRVNQ